MSDFPDPSQPQEGVYIYRSDDTPKGHLTLAVGEHWWHVHLTPAAALRVACTLEAGADQIIGEMDYSDVEALGIDPATPPPTLGVDAVETGRGNVIVSVGYEGRTVEELVSLLVENEVTVLVDVRLNAVSRKKGFSKTALGRALGEAGIEYRHERALGNPKENREPFRNGDVSAREIFSEMLGNGSRDAFEAVVGLAREQRIALLCYERSHESCHRSCITEMAKKHHDISCLAV